MLTKRKYNSHAVAEALIQHFGEMLRCAGEVLETVKGEHHAKKKTAARLMSVHIGKSLMPKRSNQPPAANTVTKKPSEPHSRTRP